MSTTILPFREPKRKIHLIIRVNINKMNVRSSTPHLQQSAALRVAPSSLQEEIHLFLEGRNILNILVSQPIRTIGSAAVNEKVFVSSRLGPVPSGFIILRGSSPAIFWNTKTGSAHIIRMPVDRRKLERVGSIVLSATYYSNERRVVLEDVLYYNGKNIWVEQGFSSRWNILKDICRHVLKPDSALQGFELSIAHHESLESWLNKKDYDGVYMWEFTIDKPSCRRLLWKSATVSTVSTVSTVAAIVSSPAPVNTHLPPLLKSPPITQPSAYIKQQEIVQAQAQQSQPQQQPNKLIAAIEKDTTTNLPDSYILYSAEHTSIGSPSVKKLSISIALRSILSTTNTCKVEVCYNDNFKKYEVIDVIDNNEEPQSINAFHKRTR